MTTLLVGANLADIDVLSYAWGDVTALSFRRGWTHGVLAMLVLPLVLTGAMLLWDQTQRRRRSMPAAVDAGADHDAAGAAGRAAPAASGASGASGPSGSIMPEGPRSPAIASAPWLLVLAALSVWSHPMLDFLNTYGMRFLMPFSGRWSYGDALFIIDPWVWLALTAGVFATRRRVGERKVQPRRPARLALAVTGAYVALMLAANVAARRIVARELVHCGLPPAQRMMVSPVLANPFQRLVLLDTGARYEFGSFAWLPAPRFAPGGYSVEKRPPAPDPAIAVATRVRDGRNFLSWARFPFFQIERRRDAKLVHMGDARYTVDPARSWAAVTVWVPAL